MACDITFRVALGKVSLFAFAIFFGVAACVSHSRQDSTPVLSQQISALMTCTADGISPQKCTNVPPSLMRIDSTGRIQVDLRYPCDTNPPLEAARTAGLAITLQVSSGPYCVIEGWILPSLLRKLAEIKGLLTISLPTYAHYGT